MKSRIIKISLVLVAVAALFFAVTLSALRYLYPQKYSDTVIKFANEYSLAPELVYAIIKCESNFNKDAVSRADARGLMQITPETFEWAAKNDAVTDNSLFDPTTNIRYGCVIFSKLQKEFDDTAVALCAYNAGRTRTLNWLSDPDCSKNGKTLDNIPYPETEQYVKKVLRTQKIYEIIY